MKLHPNLQKQYTQEQYSARDAQNLAHIYSFGPFVFQVARLMVHWGILEMLNESKEGLTEAEVAAKANLSPYAAKCLLEASLTMQIVLIDEAGERYRIAKAGWFLLNDPMIRVDIDFNHDVNYEGAFHLDKALKEGRPAGLEHFGAWPTIYEGLSQLPKHVQDSWFGFDHYYSDHAFDYALPIVFAGKPKNLMDVGGNTGKWAMRCVDYDKDVVVTICDLPQQIGLMQEATKGKAGRERVRGVGINLLDNTQHFPTDRHYDAIWMSQFLDCFGEDEIRNILLRAAEIMDADTRIYIMETLWDRQQYAPAAFALTQTSLYFTALANGNSKMYNTTDFIRVIEEAGLQVETIHDNVGTGGHSILVVRKP